MLHRLALPLLLAVLALAAWLLFLHDAGPTPAADAADLAPQRAGAAAATEAELPAATETAPARTALQAAESAAAGLTEAFADPRLGIPSFVGRVLRADGAPAAGAVVRAIGLVGWGGSRDRADLAERLGARWEAHTGADGRFALGEAPRDGLHFEIIVADEEHAPLRLQNLPAWPGRTRDLGELALARGFAVAGRVITAEGVPVAGAAVRAYPDRTATSPGADLGQADPLPLDPVITDGGGAFVLTRLGPGRVRLRAESALGFAPWSDGVGGAEGERVEDFVLRLLPSFRLEGAVLAEDRAALSGVPITAEVRTTLPAPNARFRLDTASGEDGSFSLPLPEGTREIRLRAGGAGTWVVERRLDRPEQWSQRLELILKAMPTLRGRVVVEPSIPAAGAEVALVTRAEEGRTPSEGAIFARTTAGADGSFALTMNLAGAGDTRFRVVAWDEVHLPALSETLRLRSDGRGFVEPTLQLVLREGLHLAGRALAPDGAPLAEARVLLRKLEAPRMSRNPGRGLDESQRGGAILAAATTGADGAFRFTGLIAGDYRVEVHHRAWSPADSGDLALAEPRDGVEIRAAAPSGIAGRVEGDLRALPALQVTLAAPGRDPLIAAVDGRGEFGFHGIAPDLYSLLLHPVPIDSDEALVAFAGGAPLGRLDELEVPEGAVVGATLRVELAECGDVAGTVSSGPLPAANHGVFLLHAETTTDVDPRLAARNALRNMRATQTDHLGRFRIAGVLSGDYILVVCGPGEWPDGLWNDDGSSDPRGLSRRFLRVDAGIETRADFLLRGGFLDVDVANAEARVSGVQMELVPLPTSDEGRRHGVFVSRRGAAGAGPFASGPYLLRYEQNGARGEWQVFIPADATATVTVTLPERPPRD